MALSSITDRVTVSTPEGVRVVVDMLYATTKGLVRKGEKPDDCDEAEVARIKGVIASHPG